MDNSRQRFVAQRYPQLQGLRLLPLASVALMWAASDVGFLRLPDDGDVRTVRAWLWGAIALAVLASFAIRRWYTSTYGWISQRPLYHAGAPHVALAVCGGLILWFWDQTAVSTRLPLPLLFVATTTLAVAVAHDPFRRHYFAIAALWFLVSGIRALGDRIPSSAFDLLIGVSLLVAGVGDHRLLARTLRPVPQSERIAEHARAV
jgi:hypothetical protein